VLVHRLVVTDFSWSGPIPPFSPGKIVHWHDPPYPPRGIRRGVSTPSEERSAPIVAREKGVTYGTNRAFEQVPDGGFVAGLFLLIAAPVLAFWSYWYRYLREDDVVKASKRHRKTVLCVWLAVQVNRSHWQRDAVTAIEAMGGAVKYTEPDPMHTEALPRVYLRRWLGRDYFDHAVGVSFRRKPVGDDDLAQLKGLTHLTELDLYNTPELPARQAYSHSASVGSR
jgi:hypothetical protein